MMSSFVDCSTMSSFGEGKSFGGGPDAARATKSVYRQVGSRLREMSGTQLLAAVVAAFLVTQVAIFTTTVYLHRALTHRALTVHPVGGISVPVVDLDHDRHAPARVGRRAPQASRRDRHIRRPAQSERSRVLAGAARQRRSLQACSTRQRQWSQVRARHPTDRIDRLAFDYSLSASARHHDARGRDVGARLRTARPVSSRPGCTRCST